MLKKTIVSLSIFACVMFCITSCKKEEKLVLTINNVVAENHDGGTEVPRGGTISVNFATFAGDDARLDFYHIEIHDHPTSGYVEDEYKIIDADFKDKSIFKGLRNATVHEHVHVSDTANIGSYHVVIVVVDEDGNSVDTETLETHITVVE